jgi:iron-sulfur cluster repair protein YtfE (RIC family)
MDSITEYLSDDHSHCDDLFASAENAVAAGDWDSAAQAFAGFKAATLRHFDREEGVLFPAFEERTGMTGGPTAVMRDEHAQMRDVLDAMAAAVASQDQPAYLSLSETLLMLMRQHNMKEERILYPMADQALEARDLIRAMAAH